MAMRETLIRIQRQLAFNEAELREAKLAKYSLESDLKELREELTGKTNLADSNSAAAEFHRGMVEGMKAVLSLVFPANKEGLQPQASPIPYAQVPPLGQAVGSGQWP